MPLLGHIFFFLRADFQYFPNAIASKVIQRAAGLAQ